MANYPEWVLAHKAKGTYINKVGDKYYLYAAHSERIPGTKKSEESATVILAGSPRNRD